MYQVEKDMECNVISFSVKCNMQLQRLEINCLAIGHTITWALKHVARWPEFTWPDHIMTCGGCLIIWENMYGGLSLLNMLAESLIGLNTLQVGLSYLSQMLPGGLRDAECKGQYIVLSVVLITWFLSASSWFMISQIACVAGSGWGILIEEVVGILLCG